MEAVKKLEAEKNAVKISGVMDAVLRTQIVGQMTVAMKQSQVEMPAANYE